MQYIAIDIETTGLDPSQDQILEFGACLADTYSEEPIATFERVINPGRISGDAIALKMNARLLEVIAGPSSGWIRSRDLVYEFMGFLSVNRYQDVKTYGGKNFGGFDLQFLKRLPDWSLIKIPRMRFLDPATLWMDSDSAGIPSLQECCDLAGLGTIVSHTALDDAKLVVRLIALGLRRRSNA